MTQAIILGAGKIGAAIRRLLIDTGDYDLTVADADPDALTAFASDGTRTVALDVEDGAALRRALDGHHLLINACPYFLSVPIARAARDTRVHYFDLTEDVATTAEIRAIADGADCAFMPQCGLAPGFVSIVAHALAAEFDSLESVRLRVGALPQFPTNRLKYNLTWSTDGLINEYCNPCDVIHDGEPREVLALEGLEQFSLDGVTYEAFNTSGGVGSLCDTFAGRTRYLDYKTVRYPGHCELMKLLLEELQLANRRGLLKKVLENAVPITLQDVVLIFVTVSGQRDGKLTQKTFSKKIYDTTLGGQRWSAIQLTTAAAVCAVADLHTNGRLPQSGHVRQEQVDLTDFLANRIGQYYE